MKSAVYLKAGQVGLVEMIIRKFLDPDAIGSALFGPVSVVRSWRYRQSRYRKGTSK